MYRKYERLLNVFALCLLIFDFTTDILTVLMYWTEQSFAIAVTSTLVAVISGLISSALAPGLLFLIWKGRNHDEKWILYLEYAATVLGSLPQLCINLYVLSACGKVIPIVQYLSAAASFVATLGGIISGEEACKKSNEDRVWLDRLSLFFAKATACAARISIIVCYVFYEGWWALLLIIAHILILIPCGILKIGKDWKPHAKLRNFQTISKIAFFGIGFLFVWFGDTSEKDLTVAWTTLFFLENTVLTISLYAKLYSMPLCLSHVFWVTIGLILACVLFASANVYVAALFRKPTKPRAH